MIAKKNGLKITGNMKQKVFIEFGVGNLFDTYTKIKALSNYFTITIDKKYSENYTKNEHFVDKYIVGDWRDQFDIPLADEWVCVSCFEHITPNDIDSCIKGILKKIKKNSVGHLHIDLTDHKGGFDHYEPILYQQKKYNSSYLNTIKSKEWRKIFENYFVFDYNEMYFKNNLQFAKCINFNNVKVKSI